MDDPSAINFANHPQSLGEIKATKSNNARDATPRDNLIEILREIDSGKLKPDQLVILWRENTGGPDGYPTSGHYVASNDGHITLGMVAAFLARYSQVV